jgi:hypothetical protein
LPVGVRACGHDGDHKQSGEQHDRDDHLADHVLQREREQQQQHRESQR